MTFRLKTILGIALIETVLLIILVVSGLNFLSDTSEKNLQQGTQTTTHLFASAIKNALLTLDLATLESFVDEILTTPNILYIRILDRDDLVLAEGGDERHLKLPSHPDTSVSDVTDGVYDVKTQITEDGFVYGAIEIGISTHLIDESLTEARN